MKIWTLEEVQLVFSERGYQLLEFEYKNNRTPMMYRCPKHPEKEIRISLSNLRHGKNCPYCKAQKAADRIRTPFEEVKNAFSERGYELLETIYKKNTIPMRYKCSKHPDKILKKSYDSLLKGSRCPYCAGTIKHTLEEASKAFKTRGYELLEKEYKSSNTPMRYKCFNHPDKITKISLNKLKIGRGCIYCAGLEKKTYEFIHNEFGKRGYELLETEYKHAHAVMKYRCLNHPRYIQTINWSNLSQGKGCPYCTDLKNSKLSQMIEGWLIDNGINFTREQRFPDCKYIRTLSFDFYLPQHNICIEADGEQHYRPCAFRGATKDKNENYYTLIIKRDKAKDDYCKKKKIRLIRVPYFEIKNVNTVLNEIILNAS